MKRRAFLGLVAGAAVTPLAKALPVPYGPPALDLAEFDRILKSIYTPEMISALTYVAPRYWVRYDPPAAPNRQTEESADGEG